MERDDLADTIAAVPGVLVTPTRGGVIVHVGDPVPALHLVAGQVDEAGIGRGPAGQLAVRLVLADTEVPQRPLIVYVTEGDVAFAPDPERASAEIAPGGPSYEVVDLPPGVSYREMLRDFQTPPVARGNLDHFHGMVCLDGMPVTVTGSLLAQMRAAGATLAVHCDFDFGGIAICAHVLDRHAAQPWRMDEADYLAALGGPTLPLERAIATTPWSPGLAGAMSLHSRAIHEEALHDVLLSDLASA